MANKDLCIFDDNYDSKFSVIVLDCGSNSNLTNLLYNDILLSQFQRNSILLFLLLNSRLKWNLITWSRLSDLQFYLSREIFCISFKSKLSCSYHDPVDYLILAEEPDLQLPIIYKISRLSRRFSYLGSGSRPKAADIAWEGPLWVEAGIGPDRIDRQRQKFGKRQSLGSLVLSFVANIVMMISVTHQVDFD